jgi:hypothetical protein
LWKKACVSKEWLGKNCRNLFALQPSQPLPRIPKVEDAKKRLAGTEDALTLTTPLREISILLVEDEVNKDEYEQ